jgi:hypothetical protein
MGTGGPFLGAKAWPGREADHSPRSPGRPVRSQTLILPELTRLLLNSVTLEYEAEMLTTRP